MEQLLAVIDEDPDIAMLVLAASPGAEGPGPLVALLAHALGTFPVPVTIISGALSDQKRGFAVVAVVLYLAPPTGRGRIAKRSG